MFYGQITGEAVSWLGPVLQCPSHSVSGVLLLVLSGIPPGFMMLWVSKFFSHRSGYKEVGKAVTGMKPCSVNVSLFCFVIVWRQDLTLQPKLALSSYGAKDDLTIEPSACRRLGGPRAAHLVQPSDYFCSPTKETVSETLTSDFSPYLFKHIQLNQPAKH